MTRIIVTTPTFERPAGDPKPTGCPPRSVFDEMPQMTPGVLREWGLRPWSDPEDHEPGDPEIFKTHVLWLLPGEWFKDLPKGFVFTDIFGRTKPPFDPEMFSDDIRMGCLSYGVLVPA